MCLAQPVLPIHSHSCGGGNLRETHSDSSTCLAIWGEVEALVNDCFGR